MRELQQLGILLLLLLLRPLLRQVYILLHMLEQLAAKALLQVIAVPATTYIGKVRHFAATAARAQDRIHRYLGPFFDPRLSCRTYVRIRVCAYVGIFVKVNLRTTILLPDC